MAEFIFGILSVVFSEYGLIALLFVILFYWVLRTTREREDKLMTSNEMLLKSNQELLDSNRTILDTNKSLCDKIDTKLDILLEKIGK